MKILWLDLNSSYAHASLALPALHAQMMDDDKVEWTVVSATINENVGAVAGEVYKHKPDVVAATNWLFTHEVLLHILARVKALLPSCRVVMGGPEFLGDNEAFLRNHPFVNCVFRGEGEEVFPQWVGCWDRPQQWGGIEGLCYLDAEGTYHDNGLARVQAFDRLVAPEESRFFNWDKPFVQLETTRGCFNTCAFCVSGGEKPVRVLPMEVIRQRIANIRRHGIRNVRVLDRTFNYNPRHARALLSFFREFTPDICFHLEIHPALLTDELRAELATMPPGLLHLEAGIQSLREEVLVKSQRLGRLDAALDGLQYLCALPNMETHADLIAGLPLYHLQQIFDDVHTLAAYGAGEIQLESLKVLPGTVMRRRASEWGIRYSPYPPYEVLETQEMTVDDLQTALRLSRLLDGFYNAPAWRGITRHLLLKEPSSFVTTFLCHLTDIDVIDQPLSLERRGLILYEFCLQRYSHYVQDVSMAWIEAGMSLKKRPAEKVRTKHIQPPEEWTILWGSYKDSLRLCYLPVDDVHGYWYGFETETQQTKPVLKAWN